MAVHQLHQLHQGQRTEGELLVLSAQHAGLTLIASPLASAALLVCLQSGDLRLIEILWVLLHSLTGVAAGLWCRRIASKERVAARDLPARSRFRLIVGFHVLVVISMPLWFTGFSSARQISIEVASALVSAVVMMVMTAPDRAFAYATLGSAAVCGAIGLDTLHGVATPFRVLAWVAVVVGFAPLIEAVHRPQRRSIELIIENEQLVSELQIANTTLAEQVERDSLTGIGNRVLVDSFLDTPRLVGLLMIDIDHFKTVNDRDGHAAGDAVLRSVGALLDKCCREGDVVARLGGDEFVMLLDGASLDDVESIAQRLREDAAELLAGQGVTLSIGGTIGNLELETSDDLLARADANLYSAKGSGRDRAVIAR